MKLHKIYSALCVIAVALAMVGCKSDSPIIEQLNNQQVYFSNTMNKTIEITADASSLQIPVMRMGTDAASVPLKVTINENVVELNFPSAVAFAAGEQKAMITVTYNPEKVSPGHYDKVTVSFSDEYNTPYGNSSVDLEIGQAEPWVSLGKGIIKDNWVWGGDDDKAEVEILQNQLYPNRFRVVDPFTEIAKKEGSTPKDGFTKYLDITVLMKGDVYEGVTITHDNVIVYNNFNTGYYHEDYGCDIYVYHPIEFTSMKDDDSKWGNNKVVFFQDNGLPAQFSFAPLFYMPDYPGGWDLTGSPDCIVITMPGVEIADYSCEVTYNGKFEDTEGNVYGEANVELGEDVASAKATIVKGRDNVAEGAQGIINKTLENVTEFDASGDVRVAMPANAETGIYTFVVVTFNAKGEPQSAEGTSFKYTASGEVPETYSLAGTGTFVYKYVFCNEDGSPYYDEGLEYFVCDQKPNRYKITSIFYGVEFIFDVDEEGVITFEDQYTGYTDSSAGDLMVCDIHSIYPDNMPTPSYKDGNVFYFNAAYYANDGWWGYDESEGNDDLEYFEIDGDSNAASKKSAAKRPHTPHHSVKGNRLPASHKIMK